MAILADSSTKLIVQGITGREGRFHTKQMIDYGTQVMGGVTPGNPERSVDSAQSMVDVSRVVRDRCRPGFQLPGRRT